MRRWSILLVCCLLWLGHSASAQNIYQSRQFQFLSFESIPTWTCVVTQWDKDQPQLHLYDSQTYKGHSQYVSVALKTGITFAQFKEQVRNPASRKYMPLFLFDLRAHPLLIEGKSYTWAIRIEDYAYRDNSSQMTATTLRLLELVQAHIQQATGHENHGLIVLSTNPASQPSTQIAPALQAAGFPHRSIQQLLIAMGGKSVQVLNAGVGYGYLRYVPAGEEATFKARPEDIVLYARMPARVPPVNGILTLEPQTPLSHVNLLAKNRGTFNLYALDTAAIPGLHAQIGQLIRLECNSKRIALRPTSLAEAQADWAAHRHLIQLPAADFSVDRLIDLGQPGSLKLSANLVGAKAANYAKLLALMPQHVKPGFAVPFAFYRDLLHQSGADTLVMQLPSDPALLDQALSALRERILGSRLPEQLLVDIRAWGNARFPDQRIRLRSSTNCEDLPGFNGAGLYLSKGLDPDDSPAKLAHKLLQVYASLWTPQAFAERAYYGIDHRKAAMAILIHPAYVQEYANGVILTIPDKADYAIAINTQWADSAVTNPAAGQVPEALIFPSAKSNIYKVEGQSNLHDIFLQPGFEALLLELKGLSQQIHTLMAADQVALSKQAYGVDIEFKIMEENGQYHIYIKQARPLSQVLPE